ncbi:MAG: 4,5-dihydroxyphthalate decarboxylase [Chloroflexi bacterium]|nr:4,5-dihydroxyphthalate decarboxylase [Chloroflexota bacterium]
MAFRLRLSLAMERYDRTQPLLDGRVCPEGIELVALAVSQHPGDRHQRMLHHREFDASEVSLSSYLMARSRGAPFTAIPVFPRRLFSQSNIYVNKQAGIGSPKDLIGKRVGLNTYQTTLSVLAKGDLQSEYAVPLEKVTWVVGRHETISFDPPAGVRIERVPDRENIEAMLESGGVDALVLPSVPRPVREGSPNVGYLFPDGKSEEQAYYRRNGFYPIMHVVAIANDVLESNLWVARALYDAFEAAKQVCYGEYARDPNWGHLAWGYQEFRAQRQLMGSDPWPNGLSRNRVNLERFIGYSFRQGLIDRSLDPEELFASSLLDS